MNVTHRTVITGAITVAALGALAGFWLARNTGRTVAARSTAEVSGPGKALYWYDPMVPAQHFDKPGKSPFMDMQLVPRYAEEGGTSASGISIDPRLSQNLGVRLAKVERRDISQAVEVPGAVEFNGRETAIVQTRAAGFVARVYGHAPGDLIVRHAPLVDLLVPEWAAAQTEFIALLDSGDASLLAAARQRLVLLGLPPALIAQVEKSRHVRAEVTASAPITGVIDTLDIRTGMSVAAGASLATIKGLDPIWVEAAVPESLGSSASVGKSATIESPAHPGLRFQGRIIGLLPQTNADTHTLRVRIELPNHQGKWKPGMFAQVRLADKMSVDAFLVPSEAIIHTGTRDLVVLAKADHRFEPVEVRLGAQYGELTRVIAGLEEGQQVVASGQFLIDSEANLRGAEARMDPGSAAPESMSKSGQTP
ncbi:MAG: efflux RND transporter periplasmic adaptor subunit [Pseudomonadota bacterium]|nr:efflux RND transporter periplasmic adaptor subunit [Pseudomonadota bacterium]